METRHGGQRACEAGRVRSVPMSNGNWSDTHRAIRFASVRSVPMRNGNPADSMFSFYIPLVRSVPMRNGNATARLLGSLSKSVFVACL
ncbi:protein of unknown function [Kyrpidia spormannii]|uniref:Uncharacterized protein n=1 Tax=Kyrpidia spormannii TaxID=2055160 RepID=A0A6F9EGF6_9BACL|nr:protein of unknown function [Kyrpidia spormannii]